MMIFMLPLTDIGLKTSYKIMIEIARANNAFQGINNHTA